MIYFFYSTVNVLYFYYKTVAAVSSYKLLSIYGKILGIFGITIYGKIFVGKTFVVGIGNEHSRKTFVVAVISVAQNMVTCDYHFKVNSEELLEDCSS